MPLWRGAHTTPSVSFGTCAARGRQTLSISWSPKSFRPGRGGSFVQGHWTVAVVIEDALIAARTAMGRPRTDPGVFQQRIQYVQRKVLTLISTPVCTDALVLFMVAVPRLLHPPASFFLSSPTAQFPQTLQAR